MDYLLARKRKEKETKDKDDGHVLFVDSWGLHVLSKQQVTSIRRC